MSRTDWNAHKFENLDGLEGLVPSMAKAEGRKIHVDGVTKKCNGGLWYPGYKAVVNTTTGVPAQLTTDSYKILQHRDFFAGVVDLLRQNDLECSGQAIEIDDGNRWIVRCVFDDVFVEEPGYGRNIQVGGEFINSYNGKNSATGRAYMMRLSCFNQMILKNVIPECTFARNHIARDEISLLEAVTIGLEDFVATLLDSTDRIEDTIKAAQRRTVTFNTKEHDIVATLTDLLKVPAHASVVAEQVIEEFHDPATGDVTASYWDVYNAVTNHISRNDLSPNVEHQLHMRAERGLLNAHAELKPIPIEVKA